MTFNYCRQLVVGDSAAELRNTDIYAYVDREGLSVPPFFLNKGGTGSVSLTRSSTLLLSVLREVPPSS